MDKAWWKESVIYQIYPRSFCDSNGDGIGDLQGIISKLDYLKELGVDVIWLSPIYDSPNDDNGYDISNYRDIMKEFGTMDDFKELLDGMHKRGIRLMMDLVVNHTSDEHPWFLESRKSKDNPYRDYYIWRDAKEDGSAPNNWGSCFSGPAWQWDETAGQYYLHMFSVKQPDLNWENPVVRREVYDMMNWWLDQGVDGFRMDVISLISKMPGLPDGKPEANGYANFNICANGPRVHEYLQEMNRETLSHYDVITVGEASGVTIEEAVKYANAEQTELNMVFHFEHMGLDDDPVTGMKWSDRKLNLVDLKECLSKWQTTLQDIAWNSLYWDNHDQPRIVSRWGNDSDAYRELSAKMLATCLHMMQGTPYIYQGEELAMTNQHFESIDDFNDLDSINAYHELLEKGIYDHETMMRYLNKKSRDNARTPMQWNTDANAGFTTGKPWLAVNDNYKMINAEEQVGRETSVFHYYKKLIELRKANEIIVYGDYELLLPDDPDIYAYLRHWEGQTLLCICNFSEKEVTADLSGVNISKDAKLLIANYEDSSITSTPVLRPYEAGAWIL